MLSRTERNTGRLVALCQLLNAAKGMITPGSAVVAAAKAASPTIGDASAQTQLINFSKQATDALRKLKDALDAVEGVSGGLEIDSAIETLQTARGDLTQAKAKAKTGQLKPIIDQTAETAQFEVSAASKTIGSSLAQLISAATQGNENYTSVAARDTSQAFSILASSVKGVAALTKDREQQDQSLDAAIEVLNKAERIVTLTKSAKTHHADPNFQQQLGATATEVNRAMTVLIDSLPGYRDITRCTVAPSVMAAGSSAARVADARCAMSGARFVGACVVGGPQRWRRCRRTCSGCRGPSRVARPTKHSRPPRASCPARAPP